jgi:hypothetical protein
MLRLKPLKCLKMRKKIDGTYILFERFNEIEGELLAHSMDLIEERVDHVVLNLELRELRRVLIGDVLSNALVKNVHDRSVALLGASGS